VNKTARVENAGLERTEPDSNDRMKWNAGEREFIHQVNYIEMQ